MGLIPRPQQLQTSQQLQASPEPSISHMSNASNDAPIGEIRGPSPQPRASTEAPESIRSLKPCNTLARSMYQLQDQLQEQLSHRETLNQPSPLARIHFCAYPGRSWFSKGHSFVAIEPLDPQFQAGNIKMGTRPYLGTVAVGVSPKGNNTGDRITDFFSLTRNPFKSQKAQLRNDTRYLQKPTTRAWTLEIYDEQQLTAGLQRINQLAQAMNNDPGYIKSINTLPVAPAGQLNATQQPMTYDKKHNSNDYALDIFKHFCKDNTLPPALLEGGNHPNSQGMWRSLRDDFQNQPQPQTLGWRHADSLFELRRTAPHVIAQAQRLTHSLKDDMNLIQNQVKEVKTLLLAMQQRYLPNIIAVLKELMDDVPAEANVFAQVLDDFSKALADAAAVAAQLKNPKSYYEVATTVIGSLFDAESRAAAMNALASFHKVISTGQAAMEKINAVIEVVPNAEVEVKAFAEDVQRLIAPTHALLTSLASIPDRMMLYLDTLDSALADAGEIFMRPTST